MSAPQNVADLAAFAQRGQTAATDVFQSWTSTLQTVGDAAGTQATSLRRLVRGMFDLADQAVAIEREFADVPHGQRAGVGGGPRHVPQAERHRHRGPGGRGAGVELGTLTPDRSS